jgi:hypothetical protein
VLSRQLKETGRASEPRTVNVYIQIAALWGIALRSGREFELVPIVRSLADALRFLEYNCDYSFSQTIADNIVIHLEVFGYIVSF